VCLTQPMLAGPLPSAIGSLVGLTQLVLNSNSLQGKAIRADDDDDDDTPYTNGYPK
jgi:hypothetical protein